MKIFLTGASGFIGSHVARALVKEGIHEVAALIRSTSSLWRLQECVNRITLVKADLSDRQEIRSHLEHFRPEVCIHSAWYAEPGKYLDSFENISCLTESLAFLEELIRAGCQQVIIVGTCFEYDTQMGYLRETGPVRPETIYAASKLALNLIAHQMIQNSDLKLTWARLFYQFGPFEDERRVVPALISTLARGKIFPATAGEQVRDYLHVTDVVSALLSLVRHRVPGIVNVASGVPVTMRHLMEAIGDLMGRRELIRFGEVPYRSWDPLFVCGDNRRLKEEGQWSASYPTLEAGLKDTVEWWKSQNILKQLSHQ